MSDEPRRFVARCGDWRLFIRQPTMPTYSVTIQTANTVTAWEDCDE